MTQTVPQEFAIRSATYADAAIIARHRARMFEDMGELSPEAAKLLQEKAEPIIASALQDNRYVAWLASLTNEPGVIIAGAGVQLQRIFPRPANFSGVSEGRQGVIVNVFTEPEWRRKGVAALLLREIIEWSRQQKLDRLVLHASAEGRSLYERLGFVANNEMRFVGE